MSAQLKELQSFGARSVIDIQIGTIRQPKCYSWGFRFGICFSTIKMQKKNLRLAWMIVIWSQIFDKHVFQRKNIPERILDFHFLRNNPKNILGIIGRRAHQFDLLTRTVQRKCFHKNKFSLQHKSIRMLNACLTVSKGLRVLKRSVTTNMCEYRIYKMITCVLNPNNVFLFRFLRLSVCFDAPFELIGGNWWGASQYWFEVLFDQNQFPTESPKG